MTKITDTTKAFILKIQYLYDVEKQLEKVLPKMARAATDPELKQAFTAHLEETRVHSERLERIFEMLNTSPRKVRCEGIRGIIDDGSWAIDTADTSDAIRDMMIAGASRYTEHYEIAGYEIAIAEAELIGLMDIAEILLLTLEEERAADKKLASSIQKSFKSA